MTTLFFIKGIGFDHRLKNKNLGLFIKVYRRQSRDPRLPRSTPSYYSTKELLPKGNLWYII